MEEPKEIIMQKCKNCGIVKPHTKEFFKVDNRVPSGLRKVCRVCSYKYKKKVKPVPKEGFRFCLHCHRELPETDRYFPTDKSCKTGLKGTCRECSPSYKNFLEEGQVTWNVWTKEENEIFAERYPLYTNEELIEKFYPEETYKGLGDKANYRKLHKTQETKLRMNKIKSINFMGENAPNWGMRMSDETKKKLSIAKKGKYTGTDSKIYGIKRSQEICDNLSKRNIESGYWSGDNNPRHEDPLFGEENGRWKGGVKIVYEFLRGNIAQWKRDSMKACDYRCVISGKPFDNIHHLYSFKRIVEEIFETLQLPIYQTMGEYTEEERESMLNLLDKLHKKYGLGVCLTENIHKLFHHTYGYFDNTPEQFDEFKERYVKGEFKQMNYNIEEEEAI